MVSPRLMFRIPDFLAGGRVDGDRVIVERVDDDFAVCVRFAAIDDVTARDALRGGIWFRLINPFGRSAGLLQVERIEDVGEGRNEVHRVADDERRRFVSCGNACGECRRRFQLVDVRQIDFIETAEARIRVILLYGEPLPVFIRGRGEGRHHCDACASFFGCAGRLRFFPRHVARGGEREQQHRDGETSQETPPTERNEW
jgi:hypothetical protein